MCCFFLQSGTVEGWFEEALLSALVHSLNPRLRSQVPILITVLPTLTNLSWGKLTRRPLQYQRNNQCIHFGCLEPGWC